MVVYHFIRYCIDQDTELIAEAFLSQYLQVSKSEVFKALHESFRDLLQPLQISGMQNVPYFIKYGSYFHLNFFMPAYISDISEAEDINSTKRRDKTTFSCHMCCIRIKNFARLYTMPVRESGSNVGGS